MIRFGTCSWKYESWRGTVYDDLTRSEDFLRVYARKYTTVEVDQWFWSLFGEDKVVLPGADIMQEYAASVPDDFRFTIKVPNSITLTHFYRSVKKYAGQRNPYFLSNKLFEQFLKTLEPIGDRIGMFMFQFEYLNKQKMASQKKFQEELAGFISRCPREFPYAVEIRNPNYLNGAWFKFLQENKLSKVFLQGYYMPPIMTVFKRFRQFIERPVVIRLHGPDRSDIEEKSRGIWNKILEPKDDELADITKIIRELHSKNLDVYVNVNNHYEGSAPLTIRKIQALMGFAPE